MTNFTYDDLNQLVQAIYPGNTTIDYTYDAVGNRQNMTGNINAELGNIPVEYEYDYEDRLTQVTTAEQTINYTYDGDGNLIEKTITTGATTETYEYLYDYSAGLPRLLVEKKNGTETYNYLYMGRLYARKGTEGTIYYNQDGLGSILAITDETGAILNKYSYDAFGEPTTIQETVPNSILFTGEPYDAIGLYYLRARYYDPTIGRFITQDTLLGEMDNPLTQNLYVYCGNNPVLYVDPSGHLRCEIAKVVNTAKEWVIKNGVIILDGTQVVLDITGLVPVWGELADGTNAVIYTLRGDKINAALSAGAMLPLAGWASTGGKYVVKYGDEALAAAKGVGKTLMTSGSKADALKSISNLPSNVQSSVKSFFKGSSNAYTDYVVQKTANGNYLVKMTKPGNVPGSKAIYYKEIGADGKTIKVYKDTFDPNGNLVHTKDK